MSGRVDGNKSINRQIGNSQIAESSSGQDNRIAKDYNKLQILYNQILYNLNSIMEYYGEGQFESFSNSDELSEILIYTRLLNLDSTLEDETNSYEYNPQLIENFRYFSNRVIDTIKQSKSERVKVINLTKENEQLKTYKNILQNSTLLRNYLKTVQDSNYIFSTEATIQVDPYINPWYKEYINQYGSPGDGVFNSERLADIIDNINPTDDQLIL